MRTVFLLGLFMNWGVSASAQTVLPNAILDTMIFEIRKGRQCEIVMQAQQSEIKALGNELLHTGTALQLSQSESSTLNDLLENAKGYSIILTQQFTLDKNKLKAKIKRLWIWVTGEGVLIVVLIILL